MKKYLFPLPDGRFMEVYQRKIDNALPYIEKRIAYSMPIETIDVNEVLKAISYLRIRVNRNCTPEEVNGIVDSIKNFLTETVIKLPHHERYLSERGN